jgi:hypothetical protein
MSLSPARDLNGWRQSAGTASVAQSPIQKIVSLLGGRSTGSSSAEARDSLDRMREIEPLTPDMLQNADESIVDMDMTDTYGNIHSGAEVNTQRCPRAAELECSASSDTASPNVFKQLAGGYLSQGHNESVSESTERYAMSDQTCTFALLHSKPASEQPKMADTSLNETLGSDMEMTGTYGHILATTQHDANDSSMELTRCYGAGVTDGNHQARAEALAGTDESMEMTATYGKIVSTTPTAELHCTPTMEVEMEMTGTYGTILSDECSRRSMIPRPRPRAADISVRFELNESASSIGTSAEAVAVAEAEKFSVAELVEAFELSLPLEMPCRRRKSSLGAARLSASGPMASDEADHAAVLIGKVEVELLQQTAEALDKATDALKMDIEALGTMSLSDPMAAEVNSVSACIAAVWLPFLPCAIAEAKRNLDWTLFFGPLAFCSEPRTPASLPWVASVLACAGTGAAAGGSGSDGKAEVPRGGAAPVAGAQGCLRVLAGRQALRGTTPPRG